MNTAHPTKPQGQLANTAMLCGVAGALVGIVLEFVGLFGGLGASLESMYEAEPFLLVDALPVTPYWNWLLAIALSVGVAFAVLDSRGTWRRVLILLFALTLIVIASPVLVLWGVFWSPFLLLCAVVWSWLGAFVYASQHQMPCDFVAVTSKPQADPQPEQSQDLAQDIVNVEDAVSEAELELLEVQKDEIISEDKFKPKANA